MSSSGASPADRRDVTLLARARAAARGESPWIALFVGALVPVLGLLRRVVDVGQLRDMLAVPLTIGLVAAGVYAGRAVLLGYRWCQWISLLPWARPWPRSRRTGVRW